MVVDNLEVFKAEGRFYDKKTDQILPFTVGPTHNEDLVERVVESYKNNLDVELLEYRIDSIERGETERSEELMQYEEE